jgi:hypothetical protein
MTIKTSASVLFIMLFGLSSELLFAQSPPMAIVRMPPEIKMVLEIRHLYNQ